MKLLILGLMLWLNACGKPEKDEDHGKDGSTVSEAAKDKSKDTAKDGKSIVTADIAASGIVGNYVYYDDTGVNVSDNGGYPFTINTVEAIKFGDGNSVITVQGRYTTTQVQFNHTFLGRSSDVIRKVGANYHVRYRFDAAGMILKATFDGDLDWNNNTDTSFTLILN